MSRRPDDGLAYGDIPQRWDRDRFERFGGSGGGGGGAPYFEEDYRYTERDRPGRQDVMVAERVESRGPRGGFEERDRFVEEERFRPQRRRRTDRELFGDVDPHEFANMALMPYEPPAPPRPEMVRRRSSFDHFDRRAIPRYEIEEHRVPVYRPGPVYEKEEYRREVDYEDRGRDYYQPQEYREVEIRRERSVIPPASKSRRSSKAKSVAKSVTTKQSSASSESSVDEQESIHESRHGDRQSVHESFHESSHTKGGGSQSVNESFRESSRGGAQSVHESFHESSHTKGGGSQSVAESFNETRTRGGGESVHESFHESSHTVGGGGQSVHESFHESVHGGSASVAESIQETVKKFKKGKTRMPKRMVRREAIMDLGYPFEEEEFFFVLTIALEKEQIDEVIRISETYNNGEKRSSFKFEETINTVPKIVEPQGERETVTRTEWINPPSVVGSNHRRSRSHAGHRSRRTSNVIKEEVYEDRTVIEERGPPVVPVVPVYEGENLTTVRSHGALIIRDREHRSDREVRDEIARLEAERRAVRLEREAEEKRDLAIRIRDRPREEWEVVEYGDRSIRPAREVVELYDRDKEERKEVLKIEKDRKDREKADRDRRRILKLAAATLT